MLMVMLGIIVWLATNSDDGSDQTEVNTAQQQGSNCASTTTSPSMSSVMTSLPPAYLILPAKVGNLSIDENVVLQLRNDEMANLSINQMFSGFYSNVTRNCSSAQAKNTEGICVEWDRDIRLVVEHFPPNSSRISAQSDIDCYVVQWVALSCPKQVLQSCINVSTAHWYGGYADEYQYWPFAKNTRQMTPYLVNNSFLGEIGGVIERYFISSSGFGIYIEENVPLYFSLNDPDVGMMCFTAKFDSYPYLNRENELPSMKYTVCHANSVIEVHKGMRELFIDKPTNIPDEILFRYPIWSTWAQFHKDINQTNVLSFAKNILTHNFTHAQLEIDDDWTPAYGDMTFNTNKFPNASAMVQELNNMDFRVTVWVHPFFNADSKSFMELATKGYLVRQRDSPILALTPWWDGNLAGILDVSNEDAVGWYLNALENLTVQFNISSFKFDAGETSWLPHIYSAENIPTNPSNMYPGKWVELALRADNVTRHQEVRAMYRTQKYPLFVRMMDKSSDWTHVNGLKSIIPGILTYGILGYPFVLPDMIGGNAYNNQPDAELFIRWIQLNAFLPSLQFSIIPWNYNETVVDIVRKFTQLHEQIADTLIKFARNAVDTGDPIIRPLWWMAPNDIVALVCEDEFLLGDEYLVAPVVEQGARSRDIYFPPGDWLDVTNGGNFTGPGFIYNHTVNIDELAFFKLIPKT